MNLLLGNIPKELKGKNQWVAWNKIDGRKVPLNPMTGRAAASSNPDTWGSFTDAVHCFRERQLSGIGFVFNKDYTGIDLDHCVDNGKPNEFAEEILRQHNSYTELSPSGTGIHIITKCDIPKALKTDKIEIYNTGRYFTVTGHVFRGRRLIKPTDVSGYFGGDATKQATISEQLRDMKPGNVDMTLTSLAGKLFKKGLNYDEVFYTLKPHANREGHDDNALHRICSSVQRYHPRGEQYGSIQMGREEEEERKPIEVFTPSTHANEFIKKLEHSESNSDLLTGFPTIDRYTNGLKKGSVWVVGARTGVGKTSFSITVANNLLKRGKKVLIFSTEMDWIDAFGRFASMGTGISLHVVTNAKSKLTADDKRKLEGYATEFKFKPLYVIEEPEPSLREVAEEISRIQPDVFIFDHIQRVSNSGDKRYLELSRFIKGLNTLCRKYDCAAVVNSQLNRLADSETPALHHLKECGALEEEAHAVILLSSISRGSGTESDSIVLADIAKNRGPKGRVQLQLSGVTAEFKESYEEA